ncbi:MAG: hypothetical protein ACTHJ0_02805 [Flavipsychrobacter sp.]
MYRKKWDTVYQVVSQLLVVYFLKFPVFSGGGNYNMIVHCGMTGEISGGAEKFHTRKMGLEYVKELRTIDMYDGCKLQLLVAADK